MENNPLDVQIGGDHYKGRKMQPVELICALRMSFIQGCVVKYITRYQDKNGTEDLEKIVHYSFLAQKLDPIMTPISGYEHGLIIEYCQCNELSHGQYMVILAATSKNWKNVIEHTNKILTEWNKNK